MVLLVAVAAGLILTLLRARITGRSLKSINLKYSWLVFAAVLPQIIVFQFPAVGRQIPEALASWILVISQALLVVFTALNFSGPGMWALGIGLAVNFLAIVSNGGWMPISPDTVHRVLPSLTSDAPLAGHRLGWSKDWIFTTEEIHLPWLADRFTLPGWIPYHVAFSVGDILIAIGALLVLWSLSDPEKRRQDGFTQSNRII